jgi:hypothetical protein
MKVRAPSTDSHYFDLKKLIHGASLNTICEEARCPNIATNALLLAMATQWRSPTSGLRGIVRVSECSEMSSSEAITDGRRLVVTEAIE